MKKLLAIAALVAGPALLLAQSSAQNPELRAERPDAARSRRSGLARRDHPERDSCRRTTGGLDQARIMKPLSDEWTSYSGDLTGKRYSALKLVNKDNVKYLSLKWITPLTQGCGPTGTGAGGAAAGGAGGRRWWPRRPAPADLPDRRRRPGQRRRRTRAARRASAAAS